MIDKIKQIQKPGMIISILPSLAPKIVSLSEERGLKLGCLISNSLSKSPKISGLARTQIELDQYPDNHDYKIMSPEVPCISIELSLSTDPLTGKEKLDIADLMLSAIREYYTTGAVQAEATPQPPSETTKEAKTEQPEKEKKEEKKSEPKAQTISGE